MKNLSLQFLQEELKRVCDFIKFADKKIAFIAIYYSALISFVISQKSVIFLKFSLSNGWFLSLLYLDLFLAIIFFSFGIVSLFFAVFPRLTNSFTNESLFYFGTIAKLKYADFIKKMETVSEIEAKKQLAEQIYTNAIIANKKMGNVKSCTIFLFLLIFSIVILAIV